MKNTSVQKTTAVQREISVPQQSQILATLVQGATPILQHLGKYPQLAQKLATKPDAWTELLMAALPKRMVIPDVEVEFWDKYYRDEFGIKHSFSGLEIPVAPAYPAWLIVMHEQIANQCNPIMAVCRKHYPKYWQYANDLDVSVTKHDRSGTYGVWVAASQEAEFGNVDGVNLSSQGVWDRILITTTLPERLILGDTFYLKNKDHLDKEKVTLCPASRNADGNVPSVNLSDDGDVNVNYWDPQDANDGLRFRLAIV
jgi:hypothetical protein